MIYLDNHATTPLDPVALQAMLPLMQQRFANAGSVTHSFGREVADEVASAIQTTASLIGATEDELVITSGATESNNLALLGAMNHPRQKRRKIVSVVTEHKAILDPLKRLEQLGFEVQLVGVQPQHSSTPGLVDLQQLSEAVDDQTALVSVMLANNEIGVIQPLREIAAICRQKGCWLHSDATQAVGRIHCDVDLLDVDLLSFSAHKFYGPKGVGGLFVRRRDRAVRLQPQVVGGGQQHNLRSGTLNTAGIVGMRAALQNTIDNLAQDQIAIRIMRDRMYARLLEIGSVTLSSVTLSSVTLSSVTLNSVTLNGPKLDDPLRLSGNLNCCFYPLEGQSLMMHAPDLAVSSGSACTSANPEPSHVLRALGLSEDQARSSLRFGFGRFNTLDEVDQAAQILSEAIQRLHSLG